MKSMILKCASGTRDLGQCEVSRLLMSERHYHSSFQHFSISLDFNRVEMILNKSNSNEPSVKISLLQMYGNRKNNPFNLKFEHLIENFFDFSMRFYISKNQLQFRSSIDKIVATTTPRVYYQPTNEPMYIKYSINSSNMHRGRLMMYLLYQVI
jgi:hypothetical protein